MKTQAPRPDLTADQTKELLGVTTREAVVAMCNRGEFPGARKLEPDKRTSPWLIPVADVEAYAAKRLRKKQKRAQAEMA